MKRLFLSAAVLAVAASCSTNEVTDVAPAAQSTAIGFSTLNNRVTKVANQNVDATSDDYMVYALITESTGAWYLSDYIDVTVTVNADETTSVTETVGSGATYYWPESSSLDFYAYAPYTTDVTDNSTDGVFGVSYTVVEDASVDFTVVKGQTGSYSANTSGTVTLAFEHMLAMINSVELELGEGLSGYYFDLTSATFDVVNNGVTYSYGTNAYVAATVAGPASYDLSLAATSVFEDVEAEIEEDLVASTTSGNVLMIAPHADTELCSITLTGLMIYNAAGGLVYGAEDGTGTVTYSFGDGEGDTDDETVDDDTVDTIYDNEGQAFVAGTQYAITITLDLEDKELGLNVLTFASDIEEYAWATEVAVALSEDAGDESTTDEDL